jgi:hypothetical protein
MSNESNCVPCNQGTYQTGQGMQVCTACEKGRFSTFTGASRSSLCLLCPAGRFSDRSGVTWCLQCPSGTYQTGLGSVAEIECRQCSAGKYSGATGQTSGSACVDCPIHTWSMPGSGGPCTCKAGFYLGSDGVHCMDIDECRSDLLICKGAGVCVNTVGSFECSLQSMSNTSHLFCDNPSPKSCSTAGGSIISIQKTNFSSSLNVNAVSGFAGQVLPVQSTPSNFWFTCPPSKQLGIIELQLVLSDGQAYCSFHFLYVPGAVSITPKALKLSGGNVSLNLNEYTEFIGLRRCTILLGEILKVNIMLNRSVFEIAVPSSDNAASVPLRLICEGIVQTFDLGANVKYVPRSNVSIIAGSSCSQFKECELRLIITDPPPIKPPESELTVDMKYANFFAVPPSTILLPLLQVGSNSQSLQC